MCQEHSNIYINIFGTLIVISISYSSCLLDLSRASSTKFKSSNPHPRSFKDMGEPKKAISYQLQLMVDFIMAALDRWCITARKRRRVVLLSGI